MNFFRELMTSSSLILHLDRNIFDAVWTSISVAAWSIVIAAILGIPIGMVVAIREFPLKRYVITMLNTLMAVPTVVVGLVVYGFISRQGPLGGWGLLFTQGAIVIGESILAIPIVATYTLSAVKGADSRVLSTALTLGASPTQSIIQLVREVRFGVMAGVIAGFGRVISEVGVAMMLGGNIRGYTRTMTTAIALETSKGEYAFGLTLGVILVSVALAINLLLNTIQQK